VSRVPTKPTILDNNQLDLGAELPSADMVRVAATAIWDKKGFDVVAMRVREIVQYSDYLVICSASSDRQTVSIADEVEDAMWKQRKLKPVGTEGRAQGRWVLLDFGDIVVHVFHRPVREYYQLERLYADAPRLLLQEPAWLAELSPDALLEQEFQAADARWLRPEDVARVPAPKRWHEAQAAAAAEAGAETDEEEDEFAGEELTEEDLAALAAWDAEDPAGDEDGQDDDDDADDGDDADRDPSAQT
jgi:ribosome-associated protein